MSIDKLNKKIQHEYALTIQDKFPQSHNYRAYFIEGALRGFQDQTICYLAKTSKSQKWLMGLSASFATFVLCFVAQQYVKASSLLDETSKELIAYEALLSQTPDKVQALYHLSQATAKLQQIPHNVLISSSIYQLNNQLENHAKQRLYHDFLPDFIAEVEQVLLDGSQSQTARFQALKVYVMLGEPRHYSEETILRWYQDHWKKTPHAAQPVQKRLQLLKHALKHPMQAVNINRQLVSDVRNYLNALPPSYLYYTLAKSYFSTHQNPITVQGFYLGSTQLPHYFTKEGFNQVIADLPQITQQLQSENWVLARQDLDNLYTLLEQAYCFEYTTWWQNFIRHTKPLHYQNYQQGRQLTTLLSEEHAIVTLVAFIQQHTSPDSNATALFNQKIAKEFANLNLVSHSSIHELTQHIRELASFLTTLSLVSDQGRTVFELTKSRFQGQQSSDPLSHLYDHARQLPSPLSTWTQQIADDAWFIFIQESKQYLNQQWQQLVYDDYQKTIANRYPLDAQQSNEVTLDDFNHFFAPHGTLNAFATAYIKPFLNTSTPQWQPKEVNGYVMPISDELTNELIRGNVITNMFFSPNSEKSTIDFSLQKINLDPVIAKFQLSIGKTTLRDNQASESITSFNWPQVNAQLNLDSIDGNHFELSETGPWAFFKMLQKVNVLVDAQDSTSLQILFEVNGNSGRYLLKTDNPINPFSPGILGGFSLKKIIV